jgi:peptidoglycan/LPS O-acetylase OafA/YrhL
MTPSATLPESNGNKLLGLEAIRFVCAVAVLFWHYQHFYFIPYSPITFVADQQPLYAVFRPFYDLGYFGVPIFWCISGFIFFWKYTDAIANRAVGRRKFFILRFSRLYPLHFATLILVALLQIPYSSMNGVYFIFQKNDLFHFLLQLFLASNWGATSTLGDSFNGPIWSISIEILIYCVFFLLLRHVGKSPLINVAIVVGCLAAKLAKIPSPIVDCLAYFYVGGLSAMAFQQIEKTSYRGKLLVLGACIALLVPPLILATHLYREKHFSFLFLVTYTPILLFICAHNMRVRPSVQRIIEAAGNMTYSSYLIHFPLQLAVALVFSFMHRSMPCNSLAFFALFFLATLSAAYYLYRYFEVPAQDYIRNRFR